MKRPNAERLHTESTIITLADWYHVAAALQKGIA